MIAAHHAGAFDRPGSSRARQGLRGNTRSTSEELAIHYGRLKVGGNQVVVDASGNNNRDLWIIQTLSDGECQGVVTNDDGDPLIYIGDRLIHTFGSKAGYWFQPGTATQTPPSALIDALPQYTDTYRHTAHLVCKFVFDRDKFASFPQITCVYDGRKVLDPRTGARAWSENPALCLYDYLTDADAGRGWDAADIDAASVISAANYCDARGWKISYSTKGKSAQQVVEDLLRSYRGYLVEFNGRIFFRYADLAYEATAMSITDDMILVDDKGRVQVSVQQPSRWDKPDGFRARYTSETANWSEDSIPIGDQQGQVEDIDLTMYRERGLAESMGAYLLERRQLDRTMTLSVRGDAWKLDPGDLVDVTCSARGISNQLMRVAAVEMTGEYTVTLSLAFEADELYDREVNLDPGDVYNCNLPNPLDPPPSIVNVSVEEEQDAYRQRTFTKLTINFDGPPDYPFFKGVRVERSLDSGVTWKDLFFAEASFSIDNVVEGQTVWLRLRAVSTRDIAQEDGQAYVLSHTIQGLTGNPPSLAALFATIGDNSVALWSGPVEWPDLAGYVFRMGPTFAEGVSLGELSAPNYAIPSCKPGTHQFWGNTMANNGKMGATPRGAVVSLPEPPVGWSVAHSVTWDYSTGTHSNTEKTTYNLLPHLKCSHSGGALVGTWKGPVFDRASVGTWLVYAMTDWLMIGAGLQWSSQFSGAWKDIGPSRSWRSIFALEAGPGIKMRIDYGDTGSLGKSMERMEILSAVLTGRYFQIVIEITDPQPGLNALIEAVTMKFATR